MVVLNFGSFLLLAGMLTQGCGTDGEEFVSQIPPYTSLEAVDCNPGETNDARVHRAITKRWQDRGNIVFPSPHFRLDASVIQRFDDIFHHLLGIGKQHHRIVAEEQFVLHAGVA
ncbi:hypothetical protein C7477_12924 [Phyllobacterium leguminum]|uniref:Uncharacterized protein n=1 Tax=Phyllobacterium leguminum TaxID=314237 RepID=A0A318SWG9_9HYPH|nr:hypothetical protein C7477_12924 [Phyllobacterium leguminum]